MDVVFQCLAGLALIAFATRFRRFWQVLPAALLGVALIYHGAMRGDYLESAWTWISALVGLGLAVFGIFCRHARFAETSGLVGAALLLLAVILFSESRPALPERLLVAPIAFSGMMALLFLHRWPLAPVLAIISLFGFGYALSMGINTSVDANLSTLLFRLSLDTDIPEAAWSYGLLGLWLAAFLALALFAPKVLVVRFALYLIIAVGIFAYLGNWSWMASEATLGETQPGWMGELGYYSGGDLFYDLLLAVFIAASLIIARTRLFDLSAGQRAGTVHDVFISYKREDRARVEAIASALRANGLTVWFDTRLASGKSFDAEINHQVRNARAVLVCWSKAATGSEWVRAEASIGRDRGVLTACMLEPCELFPPFNLVHAEDMTRGKPDATNPAWLKLLAQLGELARKPGAELGAGPVTA